MSGRVTSTATGLLAGLLLLSLVLVPAGKAGEFGLWVNDVSGLATPWPLVASLPFPEGEITDAAAIRIVSGDKEVPAQIDVAATWRDGSIRWALAGFTAAPSGQYRVEYGPDVSRAPHPAPLQMTRGADGSLLVDTGVAAYEFPGDKLLPERAWLGSGNDRIRILTGSGDGAYLVDNRGRTARVAGAAAAVASEVLKEGPCRVVLRRSGWYVTVDGERLARAEAWFYLAAGSAVMRVTHSLVFTEDTNKIWVRDYGLQFRTPTAPERVAYAVGEPGGEDVRTIAADGGEVCLLQDTYPHFAERESRAVIGRGSGDQEKVVEEFPCAGDWAHGIYDGYGLTVVMPWLAERFPKEVSFGPQGARAALWSGRSGRELDFRAKTLVDEYFQTWAKEGLGKPVAGDITSAKSNAQAAARTHDIWLLPCRGGYDGTSTKTAAVAAARPPLALADPEWLCATEAMGSCPMLHKDTAQFPAEEALISECWDRLVLPLRAFPMTGFIAWGCYPDRSYGERSGRFMSNFHALGNLREYGLRRAPWRLYARSGGRRYYEYGRRFSRFTGDWYLAHDDAPGKERGGFIYSAGGIGRSAKLPLFWGSRTHRFAINAGDIGHWLLDYFLTGDERSLKLVKMIKESFRKGGWRPESTAAGHFHAKGIRTLLTFIIMDWDKRACRAAREIMREMVDLGSQNGVRLFKGHYGPMYKDHRSSHNILEYYLETGDELARQGFLKLIDQRYRFDRRYAPFGHKNYDAFTYSLAYRMTGDERYRHVVEQTVRDARYYSRRLPLAADLARKPKDLLDWKSPYIPPRFPGPRRSCILGQHEYHNPFIGFPTALKLLAEEGWSGKRTPLLVKSMNVTQGKVLFVHTQGRETRLSMAFSTVRQGVKPKVLPYPDTPGGNLVPGVRVDLEKRIAWPQRLTLRPDAHYHAFVTVPAGTPGGPYLVSLGGNEPFAVLDAGTDQVALYCPEGFWSASGTPIRRKGEGAFGRAGEGLPMFFRVPSGLRQIEILLGRPARLRAPDGSVAVEMSNENIGKVTVPVGGRHGVWSIEFYIHSFKGTCPPAFVRLLNVEPVVAFGTAKHLPEGITGEPSVPAAPPEAVESLGFVPGVSGQAVRLSGERTLSFPKGETLEQGGTVLFPGAAGTVEFWFRPDRHTHETPMEMNQWVGLSFLRGPHLALNHLYGGRAHYKTVWSTVRLELLSGKEGTPPAGTQWAHFFRAGQWTHIAYTWELKEGPEGTTSELRVFLNGRRLNPCSVPDGLRPLTGRDKFELSRAGDDITLGPLDGAMDSLCLSDVVRYRQDFVPAPTPPTMDEHTRALFLFDGSLRGSSAFSSESIDARYAGE